MAPPARRVDAWLGPLACFAAAMLIGSSLFSIFRHGLGGVDVGRFDLVLSGDLVVLLIFLRRRLAAPPPPVPDDTPSRGAMADDHPADDPSRIDTSFDRGVRDIRRTDPKFDPSRFAGYAGMVFRDVQHAWTIRDFGSLRDRVTPEMYGALQARCERLRTSHRVNRAAAIEITADITEAWQENGRDYVTAYIGGSIVDYTVDEASGGLVDGSRTIPRSVDEFWTFTRPAGLNFWMLSAIQAS
jgi:predicted lipid-binding transport protein (Tim44 family)